MALALSEKRQLLRKFPGKTPAMKSRRPMLQRQSASSLQPSRNLRILLQGGITRHGLKGLNWAFNDRLIFIDKAAFGELGALEQKEIARQARREGFKLYFSTGRKSH